MIPIVANHPITKQIAWASGARKAEARVRFVELIAMREIPAAAADELNSVAMELGLNLAQIDQQIAVASSYRTIIANERLTTDLQAEMTKYRDEATAMRNKVIVEIFRQLETLSLTEQMFELATSRQKQISDLSANKSLVEKDFPELASAITAQDGGIDESFASDWTRETIEEEFARNGDRFRERANRNTSRKICDLFPFSQVRIAMAPIEQAKFDAKRRAADAAPEQSPATTEAPPAGSSPDTSTATESDPAADADKAPIQYGDDDKSHAPPEQRDTSPPRTRRRG